MLYLEKDDLEVIFEIIANFYTNKEEVPNYAVELVGVEKLLGVFNFAKTDYYPTLLDKVVYLFVQINKGHFFSNGNKRLALVCAIGFLFFNDKKIEHLTRGQFSELLLSIFPTCGDALEDAKDFTPDDFALYNLSIIVADSHKYVSEGEEFDALKEKVCHFFTKVTTDSV